MKTIKMIGYAGLASAALALLLPSMTITESAQARNTTEASSVSLVHRVSHTLAADTKYNVAVMPSGYKWGQKAQTVNSELVWTGSGDSQSGYKWGKPSPIRLSASSNFSEQAANPWGRRDFSEQAANPWGRR